jgi:predicted transcriptional regulator YdeE
MSGVRNPQRPPEIRRYQLAIKNNGVINNPQRVICGVPVDIFSIMIADKYDPSAIPGAWKKFWSEFPKSALPSGSTAYGVSTPIPNTQGELHYVAGVEVSSDFVAPSGFELTTITAGNYLVLDHVGSIMDLAQSYAEAYGAIFPASGLEMREGAHLEIYDAMLDPMSDAYVMGIAIPVK